MYKLPGIRRLAALCTAAAALVSVSFAVDTHVWQQDEQSEFTRGTIKNLSVRSDGHLTLAPSFHELADAGMPYLWSVVQDSHGTLYCAGGAPTASTTKILEVTPQGKSSVFAELTALEVHALAIDGKDRLYAATSPDSKIYRIAKAGKPELFFDPKSKYVWAMAFDRSGNLYVATGDEGLIYKVSADGTGTEFFNTEETHARSMIIDAAGDLIVGTEPGGYIIRITPQGKSFVLFQTGKREVTAVAEHNGQFYAAAVGGKPAQPGGGVPALAPPGGIAVPGGTTPKPTVALQPAVAAGPKTTHPLTVSTGAVAGGSEFYRIQPDGYAGKLWSSPSDVIYAIGFDGNGKPLLGTGNKGLIYRVDSPVLSTQLLNAPPTQVTAFVAGRNGVLYATTGNVGKLYSIGPALEKSGWLESEVLDAGSFSYWGKAHLDPVEQNGGVELSARSGNVNRPQKNWSEWAKVDLSPLGGTVSSPAARFFQYRLVLNASKSGESPEISAVQLAYLPKNVAPEIREIEIEPENYRATAASSFLERTMLPSGSPATLSLPAIGQKRNVVSAVSPESSGITLQYAKGSITARWDAHDANDDPMTYKVELRGAGEREWRVLKDKVQEKQFSFDGSAFADGRYSLRVTASDAPGNTPQDALAASFESDPFVIDNTPPEITSGGVQSESGAVVVLFSARDTLSWISKAEYSVDGGDWTLVEPANKLSDSQSLNYILKLAGLGTSEKHAVAIRIFDDADNVAVVRYMVP